MGEIVEHVESVLLSDGWHTVADAVDRPGDGSVMHEDGLCSFFEWSQPSALSDNVAGRLRFVVAQEKQVHAIRFHEAMQPGELWPSLDGDRSTRMTA